ncbi:MAG: ATP-binding protein [Coriobacteriales bacterium]|nr:ATP-binding protein [Coriobacteriales bacterium]
MSAAGNTMVITETKDTVNSIVPHVYIQRLAQKRISDALVHRGAVLVEGVAHCGKQTLARQLSAAVISANDLGDITFNTEDTNSCSSKPLFVDTGHNTPRYWDDIAYAVRSRTGEGLFLLTEDTVLQTRKELPIYAREIGHVRMGTLSSLESGVSDGSLPLQSLFTGESLHICKGLESSSTQELLVNAFSRGGWPATQDMPLNEAMEFVTEILRGFVKEALQGMSGNAGIDEDLSEKTINEGMLFSSGIAQFIDMPVTNLEICKHLIENPDEAFRSRFAAFQEQLNKAYVIENPINWKPTKLLESRFSYLPRRYFADPSLAVAALGLKPESISHNPRLMGSLFKNLVVRDISEYARTPGISLFRYNDKSNKSIDLVLEWQGRWCAIMIVLDPQEVQNAAKTLSKTCSYLEEYKTPLVTSRAIITGPGSHGDIIDGVSILPFDCLGI